MANDLRTFLYHGLFRRISSVAIASASVLCAVPQLGICAESTAHLVKDISDGNLSDLTKRFDHLEETVRLSENPQFECCNFIKSLINEININYGLDLTVRDACLIIRDRLHSLGLPPETQSALFNTIIMIETDSALTIEQTKIFSIPTNHDVISLKFYWPWDWNWFGLNKKSDKDSKDNKSATNHAVNVLQIDGTDEKLPGSVYVGGVEAFAGALIFTLGLVFPPAYGVGSALMVDGARRVFNGLEEIDKERAPYQLDPYKY